MKPIGPTSAALICLVAAALSFPLVAAQAQQPTNTVTADSNPPSFEVATIKPSRPDAQGDSWSFGVGRLTIQNYTLRQLIRRAYELKSDSQILSAPEWMNREAFDIVAKTGDLEEEKMSRMSVEDRNREELLMLRSLLADRFALRLNHEKKTIPVYALVVAKTGSRLTKSTPAEGNGLSVGGGHLKATALSMDDLAEYLSQMHESDNCLILNRTGLKGTYDFQMSWSRDGDDAGDSPYPVFFTALEEQLGLKIEPDRAPVDVVVVKSVKMPEFD